MQQSLSSALLTRRSHRAYTDQPISTEDINSILTSGTYAPSAMNSQTRQFTILRKRETIDRLAAVTANALGRDSGYNFYRPAALIIVSNEKDNPNAGFDCACALQNIFLMAHGLGIGSCWINQMKDAEDHPEVRAMLTSLGVPPGHHVYGMAALGYADGPAKEADKSTQVVHFAD